MLEPLAQIEASQKWDYNRRSAAYKSALTGEVFTHRLSHGRKVG
jgi:hypothetical protein